MTNEEYSLIIKKILNLNSKEEIDKYEELISKDMYCSFQYAKFLNKRFEKGEEAISKSSKLSFLYAKEIIKDRFIEGENEIFSNIDITYEYIVHFLKKPIEKAHIRLLNSRLQKDYIEFLNKNNYEDLTLEYLI